MCFTKPTRLMAGLCAALTTSLVIAACTGTTTFRVGASIAGQEGSAEFSHDSSTRKVRLTNATGEPMDVSFKDGNGNPVGVTSTGVASGSSIDVPAGATEVVVSTPATPPPGAGGGQMDEIGDDVAFASQQIGAQQRAVAQQLTTYRIRVAPLIVDDVGSGRLSNVAFDCNVLAPAAGWDAHKDGWDLLSPILFAGPGTPVPANLDVVSFVRVQREKLGARVVAADIGQFTDFRLDFNGAFAYADLAAGHGVQTYALGNGWGVAETFIPLADFDLPTSLNGGTLTTVNTGDQQPQETSFFAEFFL